MKYIFTNFYEKFFCIGDKCSDTCCAGWGIIIDENTYQYYMNLEEPYKSKICSHIVEISNGQYEIVKDEKERCPFLNDSNLCEIYLKISPDALSETCKKYPRKIMAYYDVIMATLSTACPEVTRILLDQKEPILFDYFEDENQSKINDADWSLFNELINGLVVSVDIIQAKDVSLIQRFLLLFLLIEEMQSFIDKKEIASIRISVDRYRDNAYRNVILNKYNSIILSEMNCWEFVSSIFTYIDGRFDITSSELKNYINQCQLIPLENEEKYRQWNEKFNQLELDIEYENLAVQFIFEYYMDALNGKSLYINLIKMFLLLIMIRTQQLLSYNVESELSKEKRISIISKISRFVEHSVLLETLAQDLVENNERDQLFQLLYCLK